MNLKEFLASNDPNEFWRLSDGDRQNLLDEAIEQIEQLKKECAKWKEMSFAPLGDNHHNAAACPHCNPEYQKMKGLEKKLEQAKQAVTKSISGLEYVSYNLVNEEKLKRFGNDGFRAVESTCPETTLLIELRDLKQLLKTLED